MAKFQGFKSAGALLALLMLFGCGDGDNPKPKAVEAAPENVAFAIRGYREVSGKLQRVVYLPADAPAMLTSHVESKSGVKPPGVSAQSYTKCQGPCGGMDSGLTQSIDDISSSNSFSGELLLRDIGETCAHPPELPGALPYYPTPDFQSAWDADSPLGWYVFNEKGQTCDAILQREEILLCMADRLAQIADASNTVRFDAITMSLVFPPQELKDKFIVRDLAFNVLAHLAVLDSELPRNFRNVTSSLGGAQSCSDAYGLAYESPAFLNETGTNYAAVLSNAFNNPNIFSDHLHSDPAGIRADLVFRAQMKGHVLSAAGILLHDLIGKSVQADTAGAETLRGQAGDPVLGLQRMWGVRDDMISPYDSLRHALRVLFGRLEIVDLPQGADPFTPISDQNPGPLYRAKWDPKCGGQSGSNGVRALDLINGLGDGFSARWHDVAPTTTQQSLAMSLMGDVGIVFPPAKLENMSSVRSAVKQQLYLHAAAIRGLDAVADLDSATKNLQDGILAGIDDAALRFGLERSYDAYRLLTNSPDGLTSFPIAAPAGLTFLASTKVASEVTALDGVVVQGGLQRRDILTDAMGVLGAAQVASQCPSSGTLITTVDPGAAALASFQDAFLLGGALGVRVGFLRDRLASAGLTSGNDSQVLSGLDGAVASIRSWAAKGVVQHDWDPEPADPEVPLHLRVIGLSPDDVGVQSVTQMKDKLVIVWGEAWQAECAAAIRRQCPAKDQWGVITPSLSQAYALTPPDNGYRGSAIHYTFSNSDHPSSPVALDKKRYYVVTPSDPKGGQSGRILAAIAPATFGMQRFAGISDYQRTLGNAIFGASSEAQTGRETCSNTTTSSLPRDYCVAGMQRDMFAPLSNELTADGAAGTAEESWHHYLSIAQAAAGRADELGRDMIAKGEQIELRREGGQESLGAACGTYVSVDALHADASGIVGSQVDEELNECTHPKTYDLVFLTDDPFATAANADMAIRGQYCAGKTAGSRPGFCERSDAITHTGLGLTSYTPQTPPAQCTLILDAAEKLDSTLTLPGGLDTLRAVTNEGWLNQGTISAGLSPLRYQRGRAGNPPTLLDSANKNYWTVTRNKEIWLAPKNSIPNWTTLTLKQKASIFPACLTLTVSSLQQNQPALCSTVEGAADNGYEDCSSPCLGDARQLARIFGTHGDSDRYMYDIEAALWNAGAMSGLIPAGMFSMPVPARVLSVVQGSVTTDLSSDFETPELYATGKFAANQDGSFRLYSDQSGVPEMSVAEATALGTVHQFPQSFWQKRAVDISTYGLAVPPWRVNIEVEGFTWPNKHLVTAPVPNSAVNFDLDIPAAGSSIGRDQIGEWLSRFALSVGNDLRKYGGCTLNGPELLYPLSTNGSSQKDSLRTDSSYAAVGLPRNICVGAKGAPVFFEDLSAGTLHPRIYFSAEDSSDGAYKGLVALGDVVDPRGMTALNIDNPNQQTTAYKSPFDPSATPKGLILGPLGTFPSQFGTGNLAVPYPKPSLPSDCYVSPGQSPSRMKSACLLADPSGNIMSGGGRDYIDSDGDYINDKGILMLQGMLAGRRLRPTVCGPSDRVELFINRFPRSNCDSARAVANGVALACLGVSAAKFDISDIPPPIQSPGDLTAYDGWATSTERTLSTIFNGLAFQNLPASVVDRFKHGDFTSQLAAGKFGTDMYSLANNIEALHRAWHTVGSGFATLHSAVATARLQLQAVDEASRARELALAQQSIELSRQAALAEVDQAVSLLHVGAATLPASCGIGQGCSWSPQSVAVASINAYAESRKSSITLDAVSKAQQILIETGNNGAAQDQTGKSEVLTAFQDAAKRALDSLDEGVSGVRTAGNDVLASSASVQQDAGAAQLALGQMMGSDFVVIGNAAIPQNVNTVLNREYNILRIRYEKALDQAKRAAYLARLAIEQKLGVRFADMDQAIGPLPPPSGWIEDLCSLQGIDYSKLRCAGGVDNATGQCLQFVNVDAGGSATSTAPASLDDRSSPQIQNFANQYIGDYVSRLGELVEFYNVAFPFKEADDVALLSLRDNLLAPNRACQQTPPNLLYFSDNLRTSGGSSADYTSLNGWRSHRCDASGCMAVMDGSLLLNSGNVPVAPPETTGAASWLSYTGGVAQPPGQPADTIDPSPPGSVYQTLPLRSGQTYIASWWDMARKVDGTPWTAASAPSDYEVSIYDQNWVRVATLALTPTKPGASGSTWSERHSLEFTCPVDGNYHLAFKPVTPTDGLSLAIANVQIEALSKSQGFASAYSHTESVLDRSNHTCSLSREGFLAGFTRKCEGGLASGTAPACYYELNHNIVIDAESHNNGFGGLVGQVGVGNLNLRHVDIGVNVVGSGVLDCSLSSGSGCYDSAFLEYDLQHTAYDAAIQNAQNQTVCFNFGSAQIRSGKAIAAERMLTLPLSGTDAQLLQSPAFTKTELAGRPLSGVYRLRIKESPALVFNQIEDIQLVLHYRYWSRVAPSSK